MAKIEITMEQLLGSGDWAEVFADESSGNTDKTTEPCNPNDDRVDLSQPSRSDVASIVAAVNGENDGSDWLGLFILKDGRYLVACGGCDYTGWDCQASNSLHVARTLHDALVFGLTPEQCERLELYRPSVH